MNGIIIQHLDYLLGQTDSDALSKEIQNTIATTFSAGYVGTCYKADITLAHLRLLWRHPSFQVPCQCGQTAYIYRWAGHALNGGFWELHSYCPHCQADISNRYLEVGGWKKLRLITNTIK